MARITRPLTDTQIKQAKPKAKEYNLADGDGLSLRVKPNGSKLWLFNYYRPHTKKRANVGFGSYPSVSLANARNRRKDARKLLAEDIDPKEHRDEQSRKNTLAHNNTFEHVASQWIAIKKTQVTPDYAIDIWRSLELHIFPTIGKIPIYKIEAPNTIEALNPIAAKGSLETVKRICQRLNEVMDFSVNTGILKTNPLSGIRKAFESPPTKNMPALRPEELPGLMKELSTASIKITTRCLIEWQLHTMVRPSEAAGTPWKEIDTDNNLWHIPAERMKSKRPHTVPLSPQTIALLNVMKPISGHLNFIFPADRNPSNHANVQTANTAIKRMGYKGILVAHGLRSIASTTLNEQGFDADVIETALAHVDSNEVRAAYNRSEYLERRSVMMNWWSEHIDNAATGNMSLAAGTKALRAVN
ncbi:MAG: tyrosine-type recombinase/integrase [Spongiibacteraceae bacterium]|nr:tyrosine-type recombinase/integrase [Spongiibacteraceae bacterium]